MASRLIHDQRKGVVRVCTLLQSKGDYLVQLYIHNTTLPTDTFRYLDAGDALDSARTLFWDECVKQYPDDYK